MLRDVVLADNVGNVHSAVTVGVDLLPRLFDQLNPATGDTRR